MSLCVIQKPFITVYINGLFYNIMSVTLNQEIISFFKGKYNPPPNSKTFTNLETLAVNKPYNLRGDPIERNSPLIDITDDKLRVVFNLRPKIPFIAQESQVLLNNSEKENKEAAERPSKCSMDCHIITQSRSRRIIKSIDRFQGGSFPNKSHIARETSIQKVSKATNVKVTVTKKVSKVDEVQKVTESKAPRKRKSSPISKYESKNNKSPKITENTKSIVPNDENPTSEKELLKEITTKENKKVNAKPNIQKNNVKTQKKTTVKTIINKGTLKDSTTKPNIKKINVKPNINSMKAKPNIKKNNAKQNVKKTNAKENVKKSDAKVNLKNAVEKGNLKKITSKTQKKSNVKLTIDKENANPSIEEESKQLSNVELIQSDKCIEIPSVTAGKKTKKHLEQKQLRQEKMLKKMQLECDDDFFSELPPAFNKFKLSNMLQNSPSSKFGTSFDFEASTPLANKSSLGNSSTNFTPRTALLAQCWGNKSAATPLTPCSNSLNFTEMAQTPADPMDKKCANQIIYNNRLKRIPKRLLDKNSETGSGKSGSKSSKGSINSCLGDSLTLSAQETKTKRGKKVKMYSIPEELLAHDSSNEKLDDYYFS